MKKTKDKAPKTIGVFNAPAFFKTLARIIGQKHDVVITVSSVTKKLPDGSLINVL